MGCLTDYIGIRWCGGTASAPSSLYVNDLPGISLKQINSITDEENATFLSVWNTIQDRAERRFSLDVREAMSAKYRLKSLAQGVTLSRVIEDNATSYTYPNFDHLGVSVELNTGDNQLTPSPLIQINVQSISFYNPSGANTGKDSLIQVIDIDTNEILYSKNIVLGVGGWENYEVNQSFVSTSTQNPLRLALVIDNAEQLTFISTPLTNEIQLDNCCQGRIRGVNDFGGTYSFGSDTYGITATFNVTCSWDGLICQNKNLFSRAFWYLCGIEFLTELIYSSVLTAWTTINLQKAKDLRAEYEVEYQKSLTQVASGMNLDCDCCLDCNGGVQLRTATQFF